MLARKPRNTPARSRAPHLRPEKGGTKKKSKKTPRHFVKKVCLRPKISSTNSILDMSSRLREFEENLETLKRRSGEPLSDEFRKSLSEVICFVENYQTWLEEYMDEGFENAPYTLFEAVVDLINVVIDLKRMCETVCKENSELKTRASDLERKLKDLDETAKLDESKLILGEVACEVDRCIPELVLNRVVGRDHYITKIKDMESALRGSDSRFSDIFMNEEQRKECQVIWEQLKGELRWNTKVFRYMHKLRKNRVSTAHPTVKTDIVLTAMNNPIESRDREIFSKLFDIHQKVCKLLKN